MKRKIIIALVVIIAVIVCAVIIREFVTSKLTIYKNEQGSSSIQIDNLKLTVKGMFEDKISDEELSKLGFSDFTNDNIKKFTYEEGGFFTIIEVSSVDGSEIVEPGFYYIVYDNEKNIIHNSIYHSKDDRKTNNFLKYFNKKEYDSNDMNEYLNHFVYDTSTNAMVGNNGNSVLYLLCSRKDDEKITNLDLSKINVEIYRPSYKTVEESEKIEFYNSVFEFTIDR